MYLNGLLWRIKMARTKSQLKKIAAKKRAEEHEANRKLKAIRKQNVMMGLNEDGSVKARPKRIVKKSFVPMHVDVPYSRPSPDIPSYESMKGSTPRKERQVYSGDYVVGIASMHKSNFVPVGRGDDPKAYAQMRRN